MTRKNENSWSPWSQTGGWKGRTWRKGLVEKMSFDPGVEEKE